ncbi:MAG: DNA translocase FtsK [Planctomycetes bacterium]|nr:DNA translocase FtsK [Planctomycetota bacterium]
MPRTEQRSEQRSAAFRVIFITIAMVTCLLAWMATLTFHVNDWPSESSWPVNSPPENWCGAIGAWCAHALFYYFGVGAYAVLFLFTATVFAWIQQVRMTDAWLRFVGLAAVCASVSVLGTIFGGRSENYLISGPGGVVGMSLGEILVLRLQVVGTVVTLSCAILVGLLLAADNIVMAVLAWLGLIGKKAAPVLIRGGGQVLAGAGSFVASGAASLAGKLSPAVATNSPGVDQAERNARPQLANRDETAVHRSASVAGRSAKPADAGPARPAIPPPPLDDTADEPKPDEPVEASNAQPILAAPAAEKTADAPTAPQVTDVSARERTSPPDAIDKSAIESLCREKAYVLEQTLNEFRLEVQVVAIETGPVITVFELRLSPGIKVSQIASLTNDIARALKAPAVRVVAPLPGKNTIGIEVPNIDKEKVRLKDLIHATGVRSDAYAIPLYLGKDASGAPLVSDLTKMPHLLIAGTTGSGKSICVGSIIMSILLTRTPEEVQLILVDPKVVELAMFKDIPHLMCPIVTEMSKAEAILDWAATKMDERYALLAEAGVKDIRSYNKLGKETLKERMQIDSDEEMQHIPIKLPYIVLVIDELADLMMTSAKEVEFYLCRIAQKSRAVGIHLIVSTQRPQANVVTGLIKSNLPSRIAFRVASRLDSRIVLDQNGGEVLMGQGDMLFLPPGSSKLMRAQGAFVSDEELRAVVKHAREQGQPNYHPELIRMPKSGEAVGERDELFDQAVDIILESGRGSVSLLQRKLTIGYSRASRLVEQMYAAGIVGEYKGSQAREVLVTKDEWIRIREQRDQEMAAEEEAEA